MNLFQQFRNFFVTIALTIMLFVTVGFDFGAMETTSSPKLMSDQQGIQVADAGSFAKDIEGKTQEAMGNITDNRKDQVMGRAKQAQSDVMEAAEDAKDEVEALKDRSQAVAKDIEGKTQEAVGNITGNRKDQMEGKLKQAESKERNVIENMKDSMQGIFN